MKRIYTFLAKVSLCLLISCTTAVPTIDKNSQSYSNLPSSTKESISYYLKSDDGLDSTHVTMPGNITAERKAQIETNIRKRMAESRISADTIYFVKSINGLDSAKLTRSIDLPKEQILEMEEYIRQQLSELKDEWEKAHTTFELRRRNASRSVVVTDNTIIYE